MILLQNKLKILVCVKTHVPGDGGHVRVGGEHCLLFL